MTNSDNAWTVILQNKFKFKVLQKLYRAFPFKITADWQDPTGTPQTEISCLIPSCRPEHLKNILEDLSLQDFPQEKYEVITIHDSSKIIGSLRNRSLDASRGKYILFLDDDTRIFQKDFLSKAYLLFQDQHPDILQPCSVSLYGVLHPKQDFLDNYSFATRCCFYTRDLLKRLGGFRNDLNSYSDIELSIRAMMLSVRVMQTNELSYAHPPLHFYSLQKPLAIGQSIFKLRRCYPFGIWLLIYLNALRFLPRILWPSRPNRAWFKISLGVLLYPFKPREYFHT